MFYPRRVMTYSALLWQALTMLGGIVGISMPLGATEAQPSRRPNVVLILTDDQNFNTLGCYGYKVLTPHIDRLAREGVRFTRFYISSPACTPSRYTCLTGQYSSRCQAPSFLSANPPGAQSYVGWNTNLEADGFNVARVLQSAGYRTGFVGKWHLGGTQRDTRKKLARDADLRDPQVAQALAEFNEEAIAAIRRRGFDYAASVYWQNLDGYGLNALNAHNMEWIVKGALDFIEQNKDKPFFLYMATTLTHGPSPQASLLRGDERLTPAGLLPEPIRGVMPSRASVIERVKAAGVPENMAYATWLDDGVGAVLKKLDDLGLAENTLVIYFSDNGEPGGGRTPHPAGKATCYEGGARVPCLLRWKGKIAPSVCERLAQNIDITPTILDACGVTPPKGMHLDGRSLLPLLTGQETSWRDAVFLEIGYTRAVVTERWKYIALRYPPQRQKAIQDGTLGRPPYHLDTSLGLQQRAHKAHPHYFDADQLYDLQNDPDEQVNLANDPQHAKILEEMKGRLAEWLKSFPRPFGELRRL
ncbi:MAG: sulfatase [Abditibacteriales bacterium]|nr:sulfatase [Abditibacteriales bacterium]MDW8365036.1 sulfatase [Abditibacteriales bacterium]